MPAGAVRAPPGRRWRRCRGGSSARRAAAGQVAARTQVPAPRASARHPSRSPMASRRRGRSDAGTRPAGPRRASVRARRRCPQDGRAARGSRAAWAPRAAGAPAAYLAVVERHRSGDDAEQRRFARAVASDQADALAVGDDELRTIEQRMQAEREFRVPKRDERHERSITASRRLARERATAIATGGSPRSRT